jgi:hypothetical protein
MEVTIHHDTFTRQEFATAMNIASTVGCVEKLYGAITKVQAINARTVDTHCGGTDCRSPFLGAAILVSQAGSLGTHGAHI